MDTTEPRYEWRAWSESLADVAARIRERSECWERRESTETYFVSPTMTHANAKVRGHVLDVKALIRVHEDFEQWEPRLKAEFPVAAEALGEVFFPLLGLDGPPLERSAYSLGEFRDEVAGPAGLTAVDVTKHRELYTVNACTTGIADVVIAGRAVQTSAVESTDLYALREARRMVGLDAHPNVSYPRAIHRTLGWEDESAGG